MPDHRHIPSNLAFLYEAKKLPLYNFFEEVYHVSQRQ